MDRRLPEPLLVPLADRFKALAEPARLRILRELRTREMSVSELTGAAGLQQANLSKHLQLLHTMGFVARRREGSYVYYRLADDQVFALCDLVCDRLEREIAKASALVRSS